MIIKSFLFAIASFILTLILPFITIPVFVIFGFYSLIINCVLKFKYGNLFGGLLKGNDAFWGLEDKSKGIITSFIVIETTQTFENFLQTLKTNILDKFYKHESRLQSTRQKFGGYSFLLKNQYRIEDSFKVVNVNNTTLDHDLIQKCCCEDMPKNDTGLWEILIFDKPIQWIEKNCFAFVFRCHHSLGDGFALLDLLLHLFSDKYGRQQPSDATHRAKWTQLGHTTKWYTLLWYILFGPAIVIIRKILRSTDRNFLHKPNLCGERIIVWALEEKEELVQIVKMVKNSVPGLRFSDVILSAISKSLREFFLKVKEKKICSYFPTSFYLQKGEKVPDHITCVIPVLLKDRPDSNILDLTNRYTVAELTLPILSHNNILKEVNQQTTKLKNSPDFYVRFQFCNPKNLLPFYTSFQYLPRREYIQ